MRRSGWWLLNGWMMIMLILMLLTMLYHDQSAMELLCGLMALASLLFVLLMASRPQT